MKKFFSTIFVTVLLVFSLLFVACGEKENDVQTALQGTWTAKWTTLGREISRYYIFKGDSYTTGGIAFYGELDIKKGTYEIKDSVIHLIPDDGSEGNDLEYSYDKKTDTIILWWSSDIQFQKGRAEINYG